MITRLSSLVLVAALVLVGCGSNDEAPSKDWALSLCKRMVNSGQEDDAGNPVKVWSVLRARPVGVKEAEKMLGHQVGEQTKGYVASCKVKFNDPKDPAKAALPKDAAVLVSERGDTAFVADRF